jgi:hypothetical protein
MWMHTGFFLEGRAWRTHAVRKGRRGQRKGLSGWIATYLPFKTREKRNNKIKERWGGKEVRGGRDEFY